MGYIGADPALNESVTSAQIADDAITLAKMASGTDGAMITYDTDGNPVAITGTDGQVATSAGADAVSAFEAAGGDVSKVGTPANNEVGIWTGDGTIEGDSNLTFDGTTLSASGYSFGTAGRHRLVYQGIKSLSSGSGDVEILSHTALVNLKYTGQDDGMFFTMYAARLVDNNGSYSSWSAGSWNDTEASMRSGSGSYPTWAWADTDKRLVINVAHAGTGNYSCMVYLVA